MRSVLKHLHSSNRSASLKMLDEIILLHKQGILSDEELAELVRITGAHYVEEEVNKKLERALERISQPLSFAA